MFLNLLLDPKIFNYCIMVLYCLNILRWLIEGKPVDAWYWVSALSLTFCLTFGYKH